MRKKKDFDLEFIRCLDNLGYKVITENHISGSKSRPDFIAIKNNEVLVIESKSEEESSYYSCLSHIDNISEWREHCKNNYPKEIAIWMVHIGGQIRSQNQRIGNKKGCWYLKGFELNKYNTIPSLICPLCYEESIKKALSNLNITEY